MRNILIIIGLLLTSCTKELGHCKHDSCETSNEIKQWTLYKKRSRLTLRNKKKSQELTFQQICEFTQKNEKYFLAFSKVSGKTIYTIIVCNKHEEVEALINLRFGNGYGILGAVASLKRKGDFFILEEHVNPSLNRALIFNYLGRKTGEYLGALFCLNENGQLAYIIQPPHFGAPPEAKVNLYVDHQHLSSLDKQPLIKDIVWNEEEVYLIRSGGRKESYKQPPKKSFKKK